MKRSAPFLVLSLIAIWMLLPVVEPVNAHSVNNQQFAVLASRIPGASTSFDGNGAPPPPFPGLGFDGNGAPPPPFPNLALDGNGAPPPPFPRLGFDGNGAPPPPFPNLALDGNGAPPPPFPGRLDLNEVA